MRFLIFIAMAASYDLAAQTAESGGVYHWSFRPTARPIPASGPGVILNLPHAGGRLQEWTVGIRVISPEGAAEVSASGVRMKRLGKAGVVLVPERSWDWIFDIVEGVATVRSAHRSGQ